MQKLNAVQRKVLRILLEHRDEPMFVEWLYGHEGDLHGLTPDEVGYVVDEFEEAGLLKTPGDDTDFQVVLSSGLMSYFRDSRLEVLKTVASYLFQLLIGASGGLVVWLLTRLAG